MKRDSLPSVDKEKAGILLTGAAFRGIAAACEADARRLGDYWLLTHSLAGATAYIRVCNIYAYMRYDGLLILAVIKVATGAAFREFWHSGRQTRGGSPINNR